MTEEKSFGPGNAVKWYRIDEASEYELRLLQRGTDEVVRERTSPSNQTFVIARDLFEGLPHDWYGDLQIRSRNQDAVSEWSERRPVRFLNPPLQAPVWAK